MRSFILNISILVIFAMTLSCQSTPEEVADGGALMGEGMGINDFTFFVEDLNSARDYYADTLGFTMDDPDKFENGTQAGSLTTSVSLPDMSSIKFLAVYDSVDINTMPANIVDFARTGEGIMQYSLASSSVDTTHNWLTGQGFSMDSVQSYRTSVETAKGWSGDNGGSQELSLSFATNDSKVHYPVFIQKVGRDYQWMLEEWKTFYAFYRSYTDHPNGVVGISAIQLVVDSLAEANDVFRRMGLKEIGNDPEGSWASFQLKRNQKIELLTSDADEDRSKFLQEKGSGVYALRFEVENLDSTYHYLSSRLPTEAMEMDTASNRLTVFRSFAKGVQLEFENEPQDQAILAQSLKVGGKMDSAALNNAAGMYEKYCALCHGKDREGYAADNAPSLRSKSLLATSKSTNFMRYTIQYGRNGTAMAGYMNSQGGPMEYIEIELLLQWLYEMSEVEEPIKLSREPVVGDIDLGAEIYDKNCTTCHGKDGEGVSAPALGNPMLLATATDEFLKYAISEGRDGTPMIAFKDSLSEEEINGVTAFLRTRASGWDIPEADTVSVPTPDQYVLNPTSQAPSFDLRKDLYVPAEQVYKALQDSARMIILDARSEVAWRQTHIPGSVPVPYYEDPEVFVKNIPNDSTWIVAYCACPHAASGRVVNTLKRYGYKNTAIIDEGILVWAQMGYPVKNGQ